MFRLALALGMTVRELGRRMDARELREWEEFYGLEPFGDLPADRRMAILATVCAAPWTPKDAPPPKPSDFMPLLEDTQKETQPVDNQVIAARLIGRMFTSPGGE